MSSQDRGDTPAEVRSFALVQIAVTAVFFVLLFFMFGGSDADFPPIWLTVLLVALVAVGAFLAERVWLTASPLPADTDPDTAREEAISVFTSQTVRKMMFCEAPLLFAVVVTFVSGHGGWPLVIAGFPGLLVLTWEIWPSLRNTSLTAAMLESQGAESHLVESFLDA